MTTRALVLTCACPAIPERASAGIFQRFSLFIDALKACFDEVDLLVFTAWKPENFEDFTQRYATVIFEKYGATVRLISVPANQKFTPQASARHYLSTAFEVDKQNGYAQYASAEQTKAITAQLSLEPNLVFIHRLNAFTPAWPVLDKIKAPIFFDMDDIEHRALFRAIAAQPKGWISGKLQILQWPALVARERHAVQRSMATFVCSQSDVRDLQKLCGCDRVFEIPNTVSAPAQLMPAKVTPQNTLGFIGSFFHPATLDGANWLLEEIWPIIREAIPTATLLIAGGGSKAQVGQYDGQNGVQVLDYVDDINDFYSCVNATIAPIRFGAGTRVKIIEASGYGVPTISTRMGAEGLELEEGSEIELATDAQGLANHCIALLGDMARVQEIGRLARIAFLEHYDRQVIVGKIVDKITAQLAKPT